MDVSDPGGRIERQQDVWAGGPPDSAKMEAKGKPLTPGLREKPSQDSKRTTASWRLHSPSPAHSRDHEDSNLLCLKAGIKIERRQPQTLDTLPMALCSAGIRSREVGMDQSERVHPGCSLPTSQKGGMRVRENAIKPCPRLVPWSRRAAGPRLGQNHPLPGPGWGRTTRCRAQAGAELSFSMSKQTFPHLRARAVILGRETKALPKPFSSLTPELCLRHGSRTADPSERLSQDRGGSPQTPADFPETSCLPKDFQSSSGLRERRNSCSLRRQSAGGGDS